MKNKNTEAKKENKNTKWKVWVGVAMIVVALALMAIFTRDLGFSMVRWTEMPMGGLIRQAEWAAASVYTELILEVLLITMGIIWIGNKRMPKWLPIVFGILLVILVTIHFIYTMGASMETVFSLE